MVEDHLRYWKNPEWIIDTQWGYALLVLIVAHPATGGLVRIAEGRVMGVDTPDVEGVKAALIDRANAKVPRDAVTG